jgi:hypothetical protein
LSQNSNFFADCFGENISKNHSIGPSSQPAEILQKSSDNVSVKTREKPIFESTLGFQRKSSEITFPVETWLCDSCALCPHSNPMIAAYPATELEQTIVSLQDRIRLFLRLKLFTVSRQSSDLWI